MEYANWMSAVSDDVKLCNLVLPGTHNSGARKMSAIANCQDATLAEQFLGGVRFFDIRLDTAAIRKKIVFAHAVVMGEELKPGLSELGKLIKESESEFSVISIRLYGDSRFGPYTHKCRVNKEKLIEIINDTLCPEEYALTDESAADLTLGEIRKSNKKFIIVGDSNLIPSAVNLKLNCSWSGDRHALDMPSFIDTTGEAFNAFDGKGMFLFETQLTGGPGTAAGFKGPRRVNLDTLDGFNEIIEKIRNNDDYLNKANIISGDYMVDVGDKIKHILALNINKGNVKPEMLNDFENMLK